MTAPAVELKPDGANIPVTEDNKKEYVKLIVRYRLLRGIEEQVASIKRGFSEIVPHEFLDMFDERELELVIGGLGEIDLDDWKRNTEYRYCDEADRQVRRPALPPRCPHRRSRNGSGRRWSSWTTRCARACCNS